METNPVDSKASKPPFSRRKLFRWGIGFWIVVWIVSVCGYQSFYVSVSGCRSANLDIGHGAVKCRVSQAMADENKFRVNHDNLFSRESIRQIHDGYGIMGILARGGWKHVKGVTTVSFPIAGFLWLWLAAGWSSEVSLRRLAEVKADDYTTSSTSSRHRLIGLTAALIALGIITPCLAIRGRQVETAPECVFKIREIQHAVRGWSSIKGLIDGDPIRWEEIFGPGGVLVK